MRLPQLTAERGIGPSLGSYVRTAVPGGIPAAADRRALAPQSNGGTAFDNLVNAAEEAWQADIVPMRGRAHTPLCPNELTCWGRADSMYRNAHICCTEATHKCKQALDGTPTCVPRQGQ
jgi:hypothetical protein